jgi:tetratricopeptide (TPR) repeat protein
MDVEFKVGDLIENRYRVLDVIGTGGMGTLYRVLDEAREGEVVALKTVRLRGAAAEAPESVERFQREFQLLTQLRHPNLVSVYEYGVTSEGELYFTMEWVEGEDLAPSLRPLEPGATIPVIVQVCRALAYLHARGVIHGDLKPRNVLMAADAGEQVKLVDFGVAYEIRAPEDRARYYTPGYTAPETRQPQPVDQRADLYSLGAMWYALLVGEAPMFMPGPGRERLIRFALDEVLAEQNQIPKGIGGVIARLMVESPDARYRSANEVIQAVNEVTGSAYELETRETASSYALRTRFVNREAEFGVLQTAWEQAQASEEKLVLVSGEGGVGKTRLLEEFIVRVELEGARVARGQCVEGGGAYRPWREALRVLLRYVEGADDAGLEQAGPVLATILPELWGRNYMQALAPPVDLEPQAAQLRLNRAIAQVLRAAAKLRPTVIAIEDAHWADEATLELLRFLTRTPGAVGLQVCVTYRDDEVGPEHLLAMLGGERVQRIPLQPLPPKDTTELVRSMLGLDELPALLTERVQRTTGGNTFFVQEMICALAEDGVVLQRTVEGWRVDHKALREARLPESIRQTVWQHLNRLSAETRQALRWAAIVGSVFWEGGVAEVGQAPWQRVRVALREGVAQGLVEERDESAFAGEREYLFNSPIVREVSYESIPEEERQEVHSRAAAWLMARSDEEVGEHLGLIADHLEQAGEMEQAIVYLTRAGEQAAAHFANTEALNYLSRALDLMAENEWGKRYDALLTREKVYDLQGAREAQDQDLTALGELAEALDEDTRRLEVALRRISYAEAVGDYAAAIASAQRAIGLAQASGDVESEATAYLRWGRALWRQGDYAAAQSPLEQSLALAQAAGLRQVEAGSLRDLSLVTSYQRGDFTRGKLYLEQSLRISRELDDRQGEGETLNLLGGFHRENGDYAEAQAYYEQTLRIAQEIGDRRVEGFAVGNLGMLARERGDYAQASRYNEQSLRILRETGDRLYGGFAVEQLGLLARIQGDYAQAQIYFEQTLAIGRELDALMLEVLGLSDLSVLYRDRGDSQAALEYAQKALPLAQKSGNLVDQAIAWVALGYAWEGEGRLEEAANAYRQVLTLRDESRLYDLTIESLAGLARVSLAQGNLAQAQAHVEKILKRLETRPPDEMAEPFRMYLTCYRVLRTNQDSRAEDILNTAYRLLQERAAKIDDEEMQRSFLENVPAHREIIEAWKSR